MSGAKYIGGAVAHGTSESRKLAPTGLTAGNAFRKTRPIATGPYCASTYVTIAHTCPDTCSFKGAGCYAQSGFTGRAIKLMDKRGALGARRNPDQPMIDEAQAIDALFPRGVPKDGGRDGKVGRDLRIHMSGDVTSKWGARILARAAERYQARGGGSVWTYTARWREVPREDWGTINVLASVQNAEDADAAVKLGYAPAWTFALLPHVIAWRRRLQGESIRMVPCPYETRGTTCVQCRLCIDRDLPKLGLGIAFGFHGPGRKLKKHLQMMEATP